MASKAELAAIASHTDSQTVALRVIAGLLIVGAMWTMAGVVVPFALALVMAIALSPVAERIEQAGGGRSLGALVCTLAMAAALVGTVFLVGYQTRTILRDSDRLLHGFARMLDRSSHSTGMDKILQSFSNHDSQASTGGAELRRPPRHPLPSFTAEQSNGKEQTGREPAADGPASNHSLAYWDEQVRQNVTMIGRWIATGLGGMLGFVGGVVIFLAFLFYMLETRTEWVERVRLATFYMGLRPRHKELYQVQKEIVTYLGCLSLVSLGYATIVSLALWAIGIPQPLLWGVMAGLLEFIPYFGPLIASALPTLVALSLGKGWWQPALTAGLFVGLHTIDGYVITPLLYGKAIRFNSVMILLGVLFFGWLWGPLGLTVAMPMMIILRGIIAISPETPALDALIEPENAATKEAAPAPVATAP